MRNHIPRQAMLISGAMLVVLSVGERTSASLFATFNLNQGLYEYGSPFFNSTQTTPVNDTSLPFQQTVSQTTATNSVTATYNAYDNGTTAGLTINSSGYTTALSNTVQEQSAGPLQGTDYTTFSFTQPVSYTIAYQVTGTPFGGQFYLTEPYYPNYIIDNNVLGATFSQRGDLSPNTVYTLDEFWLLSNLNNSNPANLSGTDAISLTFTAIPEPGSLSLLLVPLALLRRRRRITAQHV